VGQKGQKERKSEKKVLANKAINKKRGEQALARYYENPQICKQCGKTIEVQEGKTIAEARVKQFCDHSCAARFNNQGIDRWEKNRGFKQRTRKTANGITKINICESCGRDIIIEPKKRIDGQKGYWYYDRQYCDKCLLGLRQQRIIEQATKNGFTTYFDKIADGLTFGELKSLFSRNQYYWFRSVINKHARAVIKKNNRALECQICLFDVQVDVCHRKDVAVFAIEDKVLEINANENLVILCPNHHVMFDRGMIDV